MNRWVAGAAALLCVGCGATTAQLRSRAAFDLGCEESKLEIVEIDARTRGVTGCGQQVTYVASCEGANSAACTWVMNSDASVARAHGGRRTSARDNPDLVTPKASYDTIAAENEATERVVVLSVGPRHKKVVRYTALTEKQSFRECREIALVTDSDRTAVPARYRGQLQGESVSESLEADVDDALLGRLGRAREASLEACGATVALGATFREAMPKGEPEPSVKADPGVRLRLVLESTVVVLQASPANEEGTAWLGVLVKGAATHPEACEVKLVLDGEAVELPPFTHADDPEGEAYRAEVPMALVERVTTATRAVGKVCETRFRLAEAELAQVKDFLIRYREERALSK